MVGLCILGALAWYAKTTGRWTLLSLFPPLFKDVEIPLAHWGIIGVGLFLAVEWLVVVGSANAANITDRLAAHEGQNDLV